MRQNSRWIALVLIGVGNAHAQGPAELFQQKCMSCHVAPDLQFPVDQAWLSQVKSTA